MEVYPIDFPGLPPGTIRQVDFKTVISELERGREFRRRKWVFPKRSFRLKYSYLTKEQADTLWNFFIRHQGAYRPFLFRFPYKSWNYGEFVAKGDGETKQFDLPATDVSEITVYIDGVPSHFSLLPGVGDGGKDRIEFPDPPPAGSTITADFYGYLMITARFAEDSLSSEIWQAYLQNIGIGIVEVR